MKLQVIDPFDIWIDPKVTHLHPRWWHKLMFWRKFVYPEMHTNRIWKSIGELENKNR